MKLGMLPRRSSPEIGQGVHLHRRLGRAEMRPWENRQAQVDGGRVQRVDSVGEVQPEILVGIQLSGLGDQALGQARVDAPVAWLFGARLVGVGQRRAPSRLTEAHAVEFRRLHRQAGLDVAQGLPVRQLRESHHPVMLGAGQRPYPMVPAVARDDPPERRPRQKIHELGEQGLADVHGRLLGKLPRSGPRRSNRHHPFLPANPRDPWLSGRRHIS